MRRLKRPALLLLLVAVVTLPAIADKAKDLYSKGEDAEARQNFEAAYGFFKQAVPSAILEAVDHEKNRASQEIRRVLEVAVAARGV